MDPSLVADIPLTQTFHYRTTTHHYDVRWTAIGDASLPPLIFVHGTPWSSRVWHVFARSLARYFHVYLFDNPGFGESPLGTPLPGKEEAISKEVALDADLAQQSEVFAALYQSWSKDWPRAHKKAHVVAHDHGGLMSLRAHLIHSCEFASLCLINVVALGPFGQPLFKSVAENEDVFTSLTGPDVRRNGRKGFIRQMAQANSRSTEAVEGRYSEVGQVMPVRIIWGTEDQWIPVETAERLRAKLNAREVVLIEGAGHLVMYDQEGRLGMELGWWLSALREAVEVTEFGSRDLNY
ncbi:uncharacterized protein An09g00710 [Aspergillus niger]|uniref:Contig An09c0030, genomic contig n=2 Tax=Aspergillus niger TaxID=5061 RepID=A2QT43_ASPNC|nr:uncharacterized protein An09g00710 [Aspergillus niger]CAL00331.1 unnamed protein product [Aspergillus niger]